VFAGSAAARIHDIPTVAALVSRLEAEYESAAAASSSAPGEGDRA
jgi:hypothetical protein